MRRESMIAARLILVLTMTLVMGSALQTANAQQIRITPTLTMNPVADPGSIALSGPESHANRLGNTRRQALQDQGFADGTTYHKRRQTRGEQVPSEQSQNTIPYWSDSFTYQGLDFTYRMVGSDPKKGSRTTVIPTMIIPLAFVFPNGSVYNAAIDPVDGETAVQRIIESPVFQNYDFVIGGTRVGNTQYGDAFQRANFWNSVSTRARDYHVLLGQPTVLAAQTVIVPADKDLSGISPRTGLWQPRVDEDFLLGVQESLVTQLNISPRSLPILVWGPIITPISAAEHFWLPTPNGPVTYIGTTYHSGDNGFFDFGGNIYPFSHEVIEWLNDPFTDNYTPGWNFAFDPPSTRCITWPDDILEVGDPLEVYRGSDKSLITPTFTYQVADGVFIDYFTRAKRSRSVNGQYSMFNLRLQNGPPVSTSPECVGDVHLRPQLIDVPGSLVTEAWGINNQGDVVGRYGAPPDGFAHGFVMKNGEFRTIDFPGAVATGAYKIDESGAIVGYFYDSGINLHGFLFRNGRFQQLDVPGASNTVAFGLNSSGDIVGAYDLSQPVTHGFILRNGIYMTFDTPFGANNEVIAINDLGELVGASWTPPDPSEFGFIRRRNGLSELNMDGAIQTVMNTLNNVGMQGGVFIDGTYFYQNGFINLFGSSHELIAPYDRLTEFPLFVNGNNDLNRVVGNTSDLNSLKNVGFVADLPITNRRDNADNR